LYGILNFGDIKREYKRYRWRISLGWEQMKRNCGKGTKDKAHFLRFKTGTVGKGVKWLRSGTHRGDRGGWRYLVPGICARSNPTADDC